MRLILNASQIAQLVERWTSDQRSVSSKPTSATKLFFLGITKLFFYESRVNPIFPKHDFFYIFFLKFFFSSILFVSFKFLNITAEKSKKFCYLYILVIIYHDLIIWIFIDDDNNTYIVMSIRTVVII